MSNISRPSANTITDLTWLVGPDGQPRSAAANSPAPISTPYTPIIGRTTSLLWELKARLKHLIGIHSMHPLQIWDWSEPENVRVRASGEICWLCPHSEP